MKKITYSTFGGPEILEMTESPVPALTSATLLIKVKAVSINPLDWKIFKGEMTLMSGRKFPRGLGIDFSGIVTETGTDIHHFKNGDEVFGILDVFKGAALAEYITVTAQQIELKPANITFEQAAAMPVVGSAALQIFDKLIKAAPGTKVLINGASGGLGMFAIQLARSRGAEVTAVSGEEGLPAMKAWGAAQVINYKTENVLEDGKLYDVVIDLSGKMPYRAAKKVMAASSVYVHTAPGPKEIIISFLTNIFASKKYKVLLLKPSVAYLKELAKLAREGMEITVNRIYAFAEFKRAYSEVPGDHFTGKAVIKVDEGGRFSSNQ